MRDTTNVVRSEISDFLEENTGKVFGRLTIVGLALSRDRRNRNQILCSCSCGKEYLAAPGSLRSGNTASCGCKGRVFLGDLRHTKEYRTWNNMKSRCYKVSDKFYHCYGGRGICVHPLWKNDFLEFLKHIGKAPTPAHTIDRIDFNGNYEPGNVRWATVKEQIRNQRRSVVTPDIARQIKQLKAQGVAFSEVVKTVGISRSAVSGVFYGQTWREVTV